MRLSIRYTRPAATRRRADSNNDALAFISLCPASPSFLLECVDQGCTKLEVMIPENLTNLGSEQVRGFMTWHLRSDVTHDIIDPANPTAHVQTVQDFYIDQSSLFLVRLSSNTHYRTDSGYESTYESVRNYSNFNKPVTIKPPKAGSNKP